MSQENKVDITLLPHGRRIQARRGATILESLIAANIFLRSDCGGNGSCGKCAVEIVDGKGMVTMAEACTATVSEDIGLRIPASSLMTSHVISKAPVQLPPSFTAPATSSPSLPFAEPLGLAVDLGTTTIAAYLCTLSSRRIIGSLAVKNPQAIHGDDVMSRIGAIGGSAEKLRNLQRLATGVIGWGLGELLRHAGGKPEQLAGLTVVGNPAMIHILLGVDPASIGIAPYLPAFHDGRRTPAEELHLELPGVMVDTLPQLSGFLGGDILAAALAAEISDQPAGTLLIDLGTNGELLLKGRDGYYATSCATGPAFEGAAISRGMQAVAGAVQQIRIPDPQGLPEYSVINGRNGEATRPTRPTRPLGICGSGIISGVAAMLRSGLVEPSGLLVAAQPAGASSTPQGQKAVRRYLIVPAAQTADGRDIAISQQDIRAVQLGKGALITGIEFLLRRAGLTEPAKIIIAGAFGSFLDPRDLLSLGMVPPIAADRIHFAGNLAGAGAIMALCEQAMLARATDLAKTVEVVELTTDLDFQRVFVERLAFPRQPGR